jgi:hypothetical protein
MTTNCIECLTAEGQRSVFKLYIYIYIYICYNIVYQPCSHFIEN